MEGFLYRPVGAASRTSARQQHECFKRQKYQVDKLKQRWIQTEILKAGGFLFLSLSFGVYAYRRLKLLKRLSISGLKLLKSAPPRFWFKSQVGN
jgi:hypothetical protein